MKVSRESVSCWSIETCVEQEALDLIWLIEETVIVAAKSIRLKNC